MPCWLNLFGAEIVWLYRQRLRMRRLIAGTSIDKDSIVAANSIYRTRAEMRRFERGGIY
ncbi:MAG: hypothetical protein JWM11_6616 [Planctomycetaceae bacterium]|nr:hypothetical protein [Planctomycetaceae bacterium]